MTAADFRGHVPADTRGDALTATRLRYAYRFRSYRQADVTIVRVESLTIDAVIEREASWNRNTTNTRLLDHEQGHADNAWIHCLKARIAFHDRIHRSRGWSTRAKEPAKAAEMLLHEVETALQPFEEACLEEDRRYDQETQHGVGPRQAEWRRLQAETIRELEAAWEKCLRRQRPAGR